MKKGRSEQRETHSIQNWRTFGTYVLPYLGEFPITEKTAARTSFCDDFQTELEEQK